MADTDTQPPPDTTSPAAAPTGYSIADLLKLAQQFQPQPVKVDQTPVSRGWLSLLGEGLGGGLPSSVPMSPADKEAAGLRGLIGFGTGLMAASRYQPGATWGSNLAQAFEGGQRGLLGAEEQQAASLGAQQSYQQQLFQNKMEGVKQALPLLQLQAGQQAAANAAAIAKGNRPTIASVAAGGSDPVASMSREAALAAIAARESGSLNVPNKQGGDASGFYQIRDNTWKDGAGLAGVDLKQYPRAIDAPFEVQHKVAGALFDKYGATPWAASAPVAAPPTPTSGAQPPAPYKVAGPPVAPPAPPGGPPAGGAAAGVMSAGELPGAAAPPTASVPGMAINPATGNLGTPGGGFRPPPAAGPTPQPPPAAVPVAAPLPQAQQPQPPPPTSSASPVFQRGPLPPDIQSRIDNPAVGPEYNKAVDIANVRAAANPADISAQQEAVATRAAAIEKARADAIAQGEAYQQNQQKIWQENQTAAASRQQEKEMEVLRNSDAQINKQRDEEITSDKSRLTGMQTEADNSQDTINLIHVLRNVESNLPASGDAFLAAHRELIPVIRRLGINEDQLRSLNGQEMYSNLVNALGTQLSQRATTGAGSARQAEINQNMAVLPTAGMDHDSRSQTLGFLQNLAEFSIRKNDAAHQYYYSTPHPTAALNLPNTLVGFDPKFRNDPNNTIIPRAPPNAPQSWFDQNVKPGMLYSVPVPQMDAKTGLAVRDARGQPIYTYRNKVME